ncbi:MAG: imidazole glycerol phosphate synthase subunit HisH [Flavobacteriales bacterium]|nr:MAG: imidazole glycerol phosphate synthase subunit HisH [Flavobacteriales bacterium]
MNSSKKIVIIDYGLGNLFSVKHACSHFGFDAKISSDKNDLQEADAAIMPGVGAFGKAMENLEKHNLVHSIQDFIASGKPFMGICLGLQLLFEKSEEFGDYKGLDIVEGTVKKFPCQNQKGDELKVPYIGWNQIHQNGKVWAETPLNGVSNGEFMYFVHSFYVVPAKEENILTKSTYASVEYCSGIVKDNVFATQFHPEKSAKNGLLIYKNWLDKI